jgi:DNA-binding MarR family transcriptional regulator
MINDGDVDPPGRDLGSLASELRVVLGRMMRRLRIEHRLPLTQASVLGRLDRTGAQSIGKLADAEHVRPQSMSQTLSELEAAGFVLRLPDEYDGRRARIELTEAGGEALAADRARRDGWLAAGMSELSEEDQQTLHRAVMLLSRLLER